ESGMSKAKHAGASIDTGAARPIRKAIALIVGGAVLLLGIALLVLPGPAFVVLPAGLAILATEFDWARRSTKRIIRVLKRLTSKKGLKEFVRANSLSLALFLLFFIFLAGQILTGHRSHNLEQELQGEPSQSLLDYVFSGHCIEAVFENWESEFLQMWALVLLTVWLRQKGAADSKEVDEKKRRDESEPRQGAPWPVWRGGWIRKLYEHSLSLALLGLFGASFVLHVIGGQKEFNQELEHYGQASVSLPGYLGTSRFLFESFQNWQSEFLSVGMLLVLSIFLREKGSPESKLVNAPHAETG
ncbi:MAG TPA: PGPGW domain-containing protein, partial [Verrucomicrobiae bacterium]|nr:PGPGW domain-containing protein [Verrucomicrobiae bacterium]